MRFMRLAGQADIAACLVLNLLPFRGVNKAQDDVQAHVGASSEGPGRQWVHTSHSRKF